jgi:hypothetical protein
MRIVLEITTATEAFADDVNGEMQAITERVAELALEAHAGLEVGCVDLFDSNSVLVGTVQFTA